MCSLSLDELQLTLHKSETIYFTTYQQLTMTSLQLTVRTCSYTQGTERTEPEQQTKKI